MELSKEGRFFPNECYICKRTNNLTRCKCNMISYCGEIHRRLHWPIHESFCKVIMELLKETGITHIHEELVSLYGSDWTQKRIEIYHKVTTKLGRALSPLEEAMVYRSRICFVCRRVDQKKLVNCPGCPIVSFCSLHPSNKDHNENCQVMRNYLNLLKTADELNIDLQFLPSYFPFIRKEPQHGAGYDILTCTMKARNMQVASMNSRLTKTKLYDFIGIASKFYSALQIIYDTVPSKIIIHIDVLNYKHTTLDKNYWEFILHLSPEIKILKVVIIGTQNDTYKLHISLCEKCRLLKKSLFFEVCSISYEEYILQKYQKPDVIFYCRIEDGRDSEKINIWSQVGCPVVLPCYSEDLFTKSKKALQFLSATFEIIYEGEISTPFNDDSSLENERFLIFKSKENTFSKSKMGENCKKIEKKSEPPLVTGENDSKTKRLEESQDNNLNTKRIKNEKADSEEIGSRDENFNADVKNENLRPEDIVTDLISEDEDSSVQEVVDAGQKRKDRSPSSSSSSVTITSDSESNYSKAETVINVNIEGEGGISNSEKVKNVHREDGNKKMDKACQVSAVKFMNSRSEGQLSVSELFFTKHISFLKKENKRLRKHLNLSVKEITKLQEKIVELQEMVEI